MKMKTRSVATIRFGAAVFAALLMFVAAAFAGPPLICHQIDIGNAKSLPWISHDWYLSGTENYDTKNLVRDTLAILDSNAPVLVRMETLRRATLYAQHQPDIAKELLTKLYARATAAESAGHADALAWFDVGYFAEVYKVQIGGGANNPATGIDGYSWVQKAISLRGDDPQMEFAAALIKFTAPHVTNQEAVEKAMAGAKSDPLLAKNLSIRFNGSQTPTMAELLSSEPTAKKSN
ncbi:MAG: hypothetical protein WB995_15570 [Candidatus Acidiferrales bacterium]